MALTKARIVDVIHKELGLPRKRCTDIVETLLEIMKGTLENGEDILISGFGKFCVKDKGERRGRNPSTGESLVLTSRRVVTFSCSGVLRQKLNQ